jgi:alkylation response protein AidB-like acyl-CoA dehydrogenase
MRIVLSEDQQAIAGAAGAVLAARPNQPADRARLGLTRAFDDEGWRRCGGLGWFGLGIPESRGGIGYGPVEEMMLFREIGRYLTPGPFLSTVAAGWIAASAGADDLAAQIVAGTRRVGLRIGGYVLDADSGGLVASLGPGGSEIVEVGEVTPTACVDASIALGTAEDGAVVAASSDPLLLARAELLGAAMLLGVAEAVRDMSADYALDRHQFGKPIGSFQAVKHRCADMAIRCYASYSQTLFGATHVERRTAYAPFHASSARLVASTAARLGAADNVQNHGAIGFTQEHVAGWYVRRAQVLNQCLDPAVSARQIVEIERERYANLGEPPADWFATTAAAS